MRRIVSVFAAMAIVAAMVAAMAMPAFANHKTDNSINAGKRSQVAVNKCSNNLNQNVTQSSTQTAVNTGSGNVGQGANAVVTTQKQSCKNFQARNSFNRYR